MLLSAALTLATVALALPQAIEDPGPHPVGWRDVLADDPFGTQGQIRARVFYPATSAGQSTPADPAGGPYKLVNFMHGWLGSADGYDDLCTHVASWGFVIVSTDTERGLFPDTASYARDSRGLLHWAEDESQDPISWLSGMVEVGADWGASGHSMGGGTLSELIGIEPRVRTIVGLQAASNSVGNQAVRDFTGKAYWFAGSVDWIVPPNTVFAWAERAVRSEQNVYLEGIGMGHAGCLDGPPNNEPMSGADQARLHRRVVTGLMRSELKGEQELYTDLFGRGMAVEPMDLESRCQAPPVWVDWDGVAQEVVVGVAGRAGGGLAVGYGFTTASIQTPYGILGVDPLGAVPVYQGGVGADGILDLGLPVEAAWFGQTLHFTALASGYMLPGFGNTASVDVP